jgi:membrane protein implicated in regulation of membrane protease activity
VNLLQQILSQPAHILWLLSGLMFLLFSILIGEPIVAALGFAALVVAVVALSVSTFVTQLLIWGILAVLFALILRGMVPAESKELEPPSEAEVFQAIPAGGVGEVSYEGSFWSARCQISDLEVAAGQTVHVIGRQGNTLIVLPATFVHENIADRII